MGWRSGRGEVIDFARNRGSVACFLAIWDSGFWRFVRFGGGSFAWGGRDGEAAGRSSEGSVATGAGGHHRPRSSAGAAGARDRLGVSRRPVCRRVCGGGGAAWLADPAGGRAVDPEAHARFVGRGIVRALTGEPVLPVLLRRTVLLSPAAVRPLVAEPLAPLKFLRIRLGRVIRDMRRK